MDSHAAHPEIVGRHCFHDSTKNNEERLINLCQEHNLRPAQSRFPKPRSRQWTWTHPPGSKHQLDHIKRGAVHSTHQFFDEVTNQITNIKSPFFLFQVTKMCYMSVAITDLKCISQLNYTTHFGDLKQKKWWFEIGDLVGDFTKKNWWVEWTARLNW